MTARKQKSTQTATGTWAADSTIQVRLDRKGAITRIYAVVRVTTTSAVTLSGANQPGGPWRLAQNLTIAGGGQTYFTLPADDGCMGGVLLHYLNRWDGFGVGHPTGVITAPRLTYTPLVYVLHCGTRPKDLYGRDNPFDLTALIPGTALGELTADWVTSGNDVMDDTVTVASAVFEFTMCHVMGTEAEILEELQAQGVGSVLPPGAKAMIPAWVPERFPHTATQTSYAEERNFPTGGWISDVAMLVQDATADRPQLGSDEVTGVAIKENRFGFNPIEASVLPDLAEHPPGDLLFADDGADLGLASPSAIFVKDLTRHAPPLPWSREYGLHMGASGVGTGDVKVGLTIATFASGDDSLFIYRRRQVVDQGVRIT